MTSEGEWACGCTYISDYSQGNVTLKYHHVCWWHRNIFRGKRVNGKIFKFKPDKPCKCGCK